MQKIDIRSGFEATGMVRLHLHVFHSRSPDTGDAPRLVLGKEVRRA